MRALEAVGLPGTAARFLDLPFYRTGEVRKYPIGEADVAIVRRLLEEVRPDTVFVAGDLSHPHGTHRMCKQAIDSALSALSPGGGGPPPPGWLYPGGGREGVVTGSDRPVARSPD